MDDDIARAIVLSLNDSHSHSINQEEDDDASFQAQLRRAIEESERDAAGPSRSTLPSKSNDPIIIDVDSEDEVEIPSRPAPPSFLSERAQMEKERRERQKRRRQEAGLDPVSDDDSNKRSRTSSPIVASATTVLTTPESERYWDGAHRPTANRYAFPRKDGKNVFRLTDLIGPVCFFHWCLSLPLTHNYFQKEDVSFAIISTFSVDTAWIYNFFDPKTPVIFVNPPGETGKTSIRNILPNWIKTTPKLTGGYGCMHIKFLLLFYKTQHRLRVVITTANLIGFDWKEIDNCCWVQDVPLRSRPLAPPIRKSQNEDFPTTLQRVLHALNVKPALSSFLENDHPTLPLASIEDLRAKWDWSKVQAHLIPSLHGKYEGWQQVLLNGHTRLMKVVQFMGFQEREVTAECQGSSLGIYSSSWLNEMYLSLCGKSPQKWLDMSKKRKDAMGVPQDVKILFPTKKRVSETTAKDLGATNLFYGRARWEAKSCPRRLFHNSIASGGPTVMHTKMILSLFKNSPTDSNDNDSDSDSDIELVTPNANAVGYAYIGSHNFTPSAWGNLSGSGFNPILNVKNYELGVVFPLFSEKDVEETVVWERPAPRYRTGGIGGAGGDEPWFRDESEVVQKAVEVQQAMSAGQI
ncbi:tyrosyl-DNA phosphodiesterase-domain-containing protein [Flagelloscypha sp. PMI_526]|nr:tyrosyl-DNA phosphodiesterase-domain-containing protein [Flagelloscypha sp. PMI_526]